MLRRTLLGLIVFICFASWAMEVRALPVAPVTFLYAGPGGAPAPCNTTLQACINGALSGDAIEIATNSRIDESLTINKSLLLLPGAGFSPLIGSANPATPDSVDVNDGGGTSVSVTFKNIDFDAASVSVDFNSHSGDSFTMSRCNLTFSDGNNNSDGIDTNITVAATVLLENNTMATTGQPIDFYAAPTSGLVTLTALSNLLTTTDPSNSGEGIEIGSAGAGTVKINAYNNVIHGIGGCNCGGYAGINAFTFSSSVNATFNIINNTIDDIQMGAPGIDIGTPGGTSHMTLNIFNNVLTNVTGPGLQFPALSTQLTINDGFNDFFNSIANDLGGYSAGSGNLSDDPLYVDASSANYRLQAGSPVIDAGTGITTGILPTFDFDGNARVIGPAPDMGAFEAPLPTPPATGTGTGTTTGTGTGGSSGGSTGSSTTGGGSSGGCSLIR